MSLVFTIWMFILWCLVTLSFDILSYIEYDVGNKRFYNTFTCYPLVGLHLLMFAQIKPNRTIPIYSHQIDARKEQLIVAKKELKQAKKEAKAKGTSDPKQQA